MPCDCELDLARRWVRLRAWGVVTYDEVVASRRKFTTDPNFTPDFSELADAREVTRIAITTAQVGELAAAHIFGPRSRHAIVAPGRETYNTTRRYQIFREINGSEEQIRQFRSIEEAEAWLNS